MLDLTLENERLTADCGDCDEQFSSIVAASLEQMLDFA